MQRTRTTTIIEARTQGRTKSVGRVVSCSKDFPAGRAAAAQTRPRLLTDEQRHQPGEVADYYGGRDRAPMTDEGGHPVIDAALALLAEGGPA